MVGYHAPEGVCFEVRREGVHLRSGGLHPSRGCLNKTLNRIICDRMKTASGWIGVIIDGGGQTLLARPQECRKVVRYLPWLVKQYEGFRVVESVALWKDESRAWNVLSPVRSDMILNDI